jgi:hypothetical protein
MADYAWSLIVSRTVVNSTTARRVETPPSLEDDSWRDVMLDRTAGNGLTSK